MKVRDFVFGSGSEKELFKTLVSQWSKRFDLFPSLVPGSYRGFGAYGRPAQATG